MARRTTRMLPCSLLLLAACAAVGQPATAAEPAKVEKISFKKAQLDAKFRSEGVAVGDYNRDGKLDIAAGSVYYAAPDWQMKLIQEKAQEYNGEKGYSNSFCNYAEDVNHDGWTDLIVVDFPGKDTWWFENPQNSGGAWKKTSCVPVTNNESPTYLDLDGDGRRELVFAFDTGTPKEPQRWMGFAKPVRDPYASWTITAISTLNASGTEKYSHGLGVGDINGDGRKDVLVQQGWWEAPAERSQTPWQFHPANLGEKCAQMYVYDFDGDGDQDVLSSAAHQLGIWWHEQTPDGWKTHDIDKTFSQTHALCLADINSDGLPDFVTGKRFWAHGPKGDVNPEQPAVMYWFELTRKDGKPQWIPHQFDHDSGVGTQFEVADVNGDGLLDVATSNKKGVYYFQQVRE